ncbi:hypothetical protein FVEN_g5711 [Fusarium venenatum]|uniref:Uncharacterized protein n=1 Tax=Fusarium venenatum TaxID=56646 RepID=A0A2L2TR96_9HYPO|nr:uncharacterized protein FVRRES_04139 [Fusarium venenatum]KAG8356391.1 hypothetical protein FVEN_g5711 [Fusarium venenatum]KAH7002907.1 hypothetical protein EDB82DRAFT_469735 [Fusarium venenatum]CEI67627.1 unnamed protein product [Fusarium venenatum]
MSHTLPEQMTGGADRQYDEVTFQRRIQFRMRTRRFLRNIPRLVQYWKKQVKAEFLEDLGKSGNVEVSALTTKEYAKLCEAKSENCDFMISCMKSDNDHFEKMIKDLQCNPVGTMSDLRIERYEASIEIRKKVITDIEKERLQLVDKKNEPDELEYVL